MSSPRYKVYKFLESSTKQFLSGAEIAKALGISHVYVRSLLKRMVQDGQLKRLERGRYVVVPNEVPMNRGSEHVDIAFYTREKLPLRQMVKVDLPDVPCVYVRYMENTDSYYVGQTVNLNQRYRMMSNRREVIYWEVIPSGTERLRREMELIQEFIECNHLVENARIGKTEK